MDSGVEDVVPNIAGAGLPSTKTGPLTFNNEAPSVLAPSVGNAALGFVGRILHFEDVTRFGCSVLQTYAGNYWR